MNDITLANGEILEVSINWLTLKLLSDYGLEKLNQKMQSDEDQLEAAGVLIHSILQSNGKKVSIDEALGLIPIDDDTIFSIFEIFKEKLNGFKKKQESRKKLEKLTK
ncbi:hypothetical protein LJC02_00790 [Breznakia sp. OttesenSCG-928-G09]|nr:hypothetical protein [Breznakia sp. OttesenSCG-928-G09]